MFDELATPALLLDRERMARNIRRVQAACNAHGVELWPHCKTHKMVDVARLQLDAGATGLTVAKLGEAEALLPSGVRRVFLAHSLVDPGQAHRLRAVADSLDELIVAATSRPQAEALDRVLAKAGVSLPVLMGIDTGLGREGVRTDDDAVALAAWIRSRATMRLIGLYSHEGHAYSATPATSDHAVRSVHEHLTRVCDRIDPSLTLWPGCSVTAERMAALPGVHAVRPGTYVFGDLSLAERHQIMPWDDLAVTVLTTVVDRPAAGLALFDAGSKTFSGDKSPEGDSGKIQDRRDIRIFRCNEEHGWATGSQVDELTVGERARFVPAHICPVINLADEVAVIEGDRIVDKWRVSARGRVQ